MGKLAVQGKMILKSFWKTISCWLKTVAKPSTNIRSDNYGQVMVRPRVKQQQHSLPQSVQVVDSFRPILKHARQKHANGGTDFMHNFEDNFTCSMPTSIFEDGAGELVSSSPNKWGSTKNIHSGEIILNSSKLFGDKE